MQYMGGEVVSPKIREHLVSHGATRYDGAVRRRWRGVDHGGARLRIHLAADAHRISSGMYQGHPGRFIHPPRTVTEEVPRAQGLGPVTACARSRRSVRRSSGKRWQEGMRETVVRTVTFVPSANCLSQSMAKARGMFE